MCLERQIVKRGQQEGEVGEKTIRRGRGRNHRKRKEPPRRRGRGGAMVGKGYDEGGAITGGAMTGERL